MNKILKYIPLIILILMINGCKDKTYYMDSDYKQINIAKFQDIQGTGYRLDGNAYYEGYPFILFFCKNNRYAYTRGGAGNKIYRGEYRVDLSNDQIIMQGDDVDSQGKKLSGTIKTKSGYFEQEKQYLIDGTIHQGFRDLFQINSSACNVEKEAFGD